MTGPLERSIPAQARSRERLERILDAAARVFDEVGYEAATTEAIAEAAETSIGSVYRFFPNKKALFAALYTRYLETVRALFDVVAADTDDSVPWEQVVGAMIDGFAAFHESEPGFRAVWLSLALTDQMIVEGEALNRQLAERLEPLFARRFPHLRPADRRVVATVAVEAVSAMLIFAARRGPPLGPAVLAEAKNLIIRYLAPYATTSSGSAAGAGKGARARRRSGKISVR